MRIIFEFSAGSRDGQNEVGESDQHNEATKYYLLTHQGTVGRRFWTGTEYALDRMHNRPHEEIVNDPSIRAEKYEVTERLDSPDTDEVYVRCRFIGYAD